MDLSIGDGGERGVLLATPQRLNDNHLRHCYVIPALFRLGAAVYGHCRICVRR